MGRQALHAANLVLNHPGSGQEVSFEAPLPEDMSSLLEYLRERAQA
jgi:23S rRNA pseudouridine1911/1915/1917 synthase